jgi:hypothetical protein
MPLIVAATAGVLFKAAEGGVEWIERHLDNIESIAAVEHLQVDRRVLVFVGIPRSGPSPAALVWEVLRERYRQSDLMYTNCPSASLPAVANVASAAMLVIAVVTNDLRNILTERLLGIGLLYLRGRPSSAAVSPQTTSAPKSNALFIGRR